MSNETALAGLDHQPQAQVVLQSAIDKGLSHAYIFHGPAGIGKRQAARAFAAEILADGQPQPEAVRRRVKNGSHPDLTWIVPRGAHEILVDDIRTQVVSDVQKRPFEASRRVYVIAQAELMNAEATNALLKTLEEPPDYAYLILTSALPERLLETVRSRCQSVRFRAIPVEAVAQTLAQEGVARELAGACARLSRGNLGLARLLATEEGVALRAAVCNAVLWLDDTDNVGDRPWLAFLDAAKGRGVAAEQQVEAEMEAALEMVPKGRERQALKREYEQSARRAGRRARTAALNLQLQLLATWFRDLLALAEGATDAVFNSDTVEQLKRISLSGAGEQSRVGGVSGAGADLGGLTAAIEHCERTRLRLRQNVNEELALEALFFTLFARGRR